MIDFHYETDFQLKDDVRHKSWILTIFEIENSFCGDINYIFCDDRYLLEINKKYLNHDTYTDIITFDYSAGNLISSDIFISIDRVRENAANLDVDFEEELLRVMSHGILHLLGFNDKTEDEKAQMRVKENEMIKLFHVEH
ncbi:rRNA maturation RNase YbeY [Saonia flava]|uniref:rRNA maturation RNase YbeY n=1 Tax=Saonia flava TaxID=523696 RepID=UPI00143BD11B|nr:rRNA maturation RNase YbeY [Saonia flava]